MQNVPQYLISLIGVWRLGGVAVPVNPMLTTHEVRFILGDADVSALIGLDDLVGRAFVESDDVHDVPPLVVTTAAAELAGEWPDRFAAGAAISVPGAVRWPDLIRTPSGTETIAGAGMAGRSADDAAVLTYTSGTTGPPKGAINTQRNIVYASRFYERWVALDHHDVVLGIAPLFHITGLIAHMGPCLVTGAPLHARVSVRRRTDRGSDRALPRRQFTIGAIHRVHRVDEPRRDRWSRPVVARQGVQRRHSDLSDHGR